MSASRAVSLPRERGGWRRWLWASGSLIAGLGLASMVAIAFATVPVPSQRQFDGWLQPGARIVDIRVPAGLPLEAVLVEEGQVVSQGQTIALLDKTVIGNNLQDRKRQLSVNLSLRKCLLNKPAAPTVQTETSERDEETRLQLDQAANACRLTHNDHSLRQKRLIKALKRLKTASRRLELRASLVSSQEASTAEQRLKSVSIALEQEQLHHKISELELQLSALITDQKTEILNEVRQLQSRAADLSREIVVLEEYHASPRIHAGQAGEITRIRVVPQGEILLQGAVLATLRSASEHKFRAYFNVPDEVLPTLSEGDPIELSLSNFNVRQRALTGTITKISPFAGPPSSSDRHHIQVALSQHSEANLYEQQDQLGLAGSMSNAHLTVSVSERPLGVALLRALESLGHRFNAVRSNANWGE